MPTYLIRLRTPSRTKFTALTYNAAPMADSLMRVVPSATYGEIQLTTHSVPLAKGTCLAHLWQCLLLALSYAAFLRHSHIFVWLLSIITLFFHKGALRALSTVTIKPHYNAYVTFRMKGLRPPGAVMPITTLKQRSGSALSNSTFG